MPHEVPPTRNFYHDIFDGPGDASVARKKAKSLFRSVGRITLGYDRMVHPELIVSLIYDGLTKLKSNTVKH